MKTSTWFILILATLALGAALRIQGINFGAPAADARPDENLVIAEAVYLLAGDQVRFHRYPPALMYVYAGLFEIGSTLGLLDNDHLYGYAVDPLPYHLIGRWFTAILGIATIVLVSLTAHRLFSWHASLVAAACMAFYPLHVLHSHFATVDVPAAFFAALAIHLTLTAKRGDSKKLIAAAFVAGVAAAVKYPVGMVAILPLIRVLWNRNGWRSTLFVCLATVAGLLMAAPTWLTDPTGVWDGIQTEAASQHGRRDLMSWGEITSHHGRFSLIAGFGTLAMLTSTLGFVVGAKRQRSLLLLVIFAVLLSLFNVFLGVPFARYFVPLAPILALATASLCSHASPKFLAWTVAILVGLQTPNLIHSHFSSEMLSQRDTRAQLLDAFANGTLPRDIPVIRPSWPFDSFPIATNAAFSLAPLTPSATASKRENLTRELAAKLRPETNRLRVFEFGEKQKSEIDLAQILSDNDMLYIEPETPAFGDESLTFPFQRNAVGPDVRKSVAAGMVKMTLLLDLDPRLDGAFPDGSMFERFEYWFLPMEDARAVRRPGPRIRVFRISAKK